MQMQMPVPGSFGGGGFGGGGFGGGMGFGAKPAGGGFGRSGQHPGSFGGGGFGLSPVPPPVAAAAEEEGDDASGVDSGDTFLDVSLHDRRHDAEWEWRYNEW